MRKLIFLFVVAIPFLSAAQVREITLEDIHKNGTFTTEVVPGFVQTAMDARLEAENIKDKDLALPVSDYEVAKNDKLVLIFTEREHIYRHSTRAITYLYDLTTKKLRRLDAEKLMHATFSPTSDKIAYVKENNLFVYDIISGSHKAVTTDGRWNHIINGNCDWVYEEEFSFTRAYQWSPKGNYLAYYRFDESQVKEYNMTLYDNSYNAEYRYKYPKAGEENSKVDIIIYDVVNDKKVNAEFEQGDIYIPRITWTHSDRSLAVFWMNRHQNHLKILLSDASSGKSRLLYEEKNKYYVDIETVDCRFLEDGKHYLFTSEMNGYNQVYLYSLDGTKKLRLSKDRYDVSAINGIDQANKLVYYTLAYPKPMDRHFFASDFSGKKTWQLTKDEGWHSIEMNESLSEFIDHHSTLNTPPTVSLNRILLDKKRNVEALRSRIITENASLKAKMKEYGFQKAEFLRIVNRHGDSLNAMMLKPANFNAARKYPVIFSNYGGPGSQDVANKMHKYHYWYQLLAQKGFIVVSVDNTGTGFRGEEFKKKTYLQLGKFEIEDQIDAAKYLASLPYVDKEKIGHWGWSYGGFMSSLAITKGSEVFSAAVAVAPVTNWRFYDNIYTERYMRTPAENAAGYDDNSPINFTARIKGKFLVIHGTGDDNVHFQNSTQLITAMVKNNIRFESAYYPNKNHKVAGKADNTSLHLWSMMTNWMVENLGGRKGF